MSPLQFHFPKFFYQFASVFGFGFSKFRMSQIPRPKSGIPMRSGIPQPKSRIPQSGTSSGLTKPTLMGKKLNEQIEACLLRKQNAQIIKQRGTYGNAVRADQLLNASKVVSPLQVDQNKKDYSARIKQKKLEGIVKKYGAQPLPNTDCTFVSHLKLHTSNNFSFQSSQPTS